jgi:hypothetical protein
VRRCRARHSATGDTLLKLDLEILAAETFATAGRKNEAEPARSGSWTREDRSSACIVPTCQYMAC